MTNYGFRGRYRLQFFINRILPKRKFPLPYKMYGGPCATSWPLLGMRYIHCLISLQSTKRSKDLWVCMGKDEFLIPTIIMNSDFKNRCKTITVLYRLVQRWQQPPKIITTDDFDAWENSDKFLARKFDIKVDAHIMDMLDNANNEYSWLTFF